MMSKARTSPIKMKRSALFIDGHYFYKVSNHYKFDHGVKSRLSITGLQEFLCSLSDPTNRTSQCIETHYFCATLTADGARDKFPDDAQRLQYYEQQHSFRAALRRQGVTVHALDVTDFAEKGVDVCLALQVAECVQRDQLDTVFLLTGDADFVPLVHHIRRKGAHVILLSWDLKANSRPTDSSVESPCISTSARLKQQADRSLPMEEFIEQGLSLDSPDVRRLFISPSEARSAA